MVTIGVDAHKQMHMAQALDDAERVIDQWRGLNTPDGWRDVAAWAQGVGNPRQWGIEGAWNYGRGLAQYLVGRDEGVYDINPRWTAHER